MANRFMLAIQISGQDHYLARRAGFGPPCVQLVHFSSGKHRMIRMIGKEDHAQCVWRINSSKIILMN